MNIAKDGNHQARIQRPVDATGRKTRQNSALGWHHNDAHYSSKCLFYKQQYAYLIAEAEFYSSGASAADLASELPGASSKDGSLTEGQPTSLLLGYRRRCYTLQCYVDSDSLVVARRVIEPLHHIHVLMGQSRNTQARCKRASYIRRIGLKRRLLARQCGREPRSPQHLYDMASRFDVLAWHRLRQLAV